MQLFSEQGFAETRSLTVRGHPRLPDDDYGLLECYCCDPKCDCRRVGFRVISRRNMSSLAVITYSFDRDAEVAGPELDPINPQSRYARELLELVEDALSDPAYVARLEAHYQQVKRAVADPAHPIHRTLRELDRAPVNRQARRRSTRGRPRGR